MATLKTKIQLRRDTATNLANVIPVSGEPVYATDTKKFSIGDGTTKFSALKDYGFTPTVPDVSGFVTGPSSSTDNAIARYDGTTGKIIQNSKNTIDDRGNMVISDGATIKLSLYSNRSLVIGGNSILADMSKVDGGWAGAFASVKDPSGTTTTMLGWYGGSTLTHIYMGGAYYDPYMKMTAAGLFTFKNQVTINAAQGTAPLAVTSTTVNTNFNADLLDGKHANEFALVGDIPTVNNGTLTMSTSGTGVSGSATFTANQSGASTFTVTLDSSAAGNRGANKVVLAKAAGQIDSDKFTVTSAGATAVTMEYDSGYKALKFVFA